MVRIVILWFLSMFAFFGMSAQNASSVLNKTLSVYNGAKGISANYSVTSSQGSTSGKIDMSGNKFRIISTDFKCWYDGTTQWVYSTATGEVNISTPTAEEIHMNNPYMVIASAKKNYNVYKAYTQVKGFYTLKLVPKVKSSDERQILLYVTDGTYNISKAVVELKNGNSYTIKISGLKKVSLGIDIFRFDKKSVPAGTEVVDLR